MMLKKDFDSAMEHLKTKRRLIRFQMDELDHQGRSEDLAFYAKYQELQAEYDDLQELIGNLWAAEERIVIKPTKKRWYHRFAK